MNKFSRFTASAIVVAFLSFGGCVHRSGGTGELVRVPQGLDSAATAKWIDAQRVACRGRLVLLVDEGGAARDFDTSPAATPPVARYHSGLAGAWCNKR